MNLRPFIAAMALSLSLTTTLWAQETVTLTDAEVSSLCKSVTRSAVSVHDPSVVQLSADSKTFYIAGTMRGWARSTDNMRNWKSLDNSSLFGTVTAQGAVEATDYHKCFSTNVTKKVKALVNGEVT